MPHIPVFSRADLRAIGWSDASVDRATSGGRIVRLRRDQFALTDDPRTSAIAAARGCSRAVVSHRSAALMHRLPLVCRFPPQPEVTVPPTGTGDLADAHLYRATLRDTDVTEVDGVPVTSMARTMVDLGRHYSIDVMVAAADYALHHRLVSGEGIADVLDFCRAWPGAPRAVRAAALIDARAESPLESVSRVAIVRLGLPAPTLQQRIRNERGVIIARGDFYWDEFGVVGEADGRSKQQRDDDVHVAWDRHTDLDDLGLQIVRWGWPMATRHPHQLEARLLRAFERGARRDGLGLTRRWSLADA